MNRRYLAGLALALGLVAASACLESTAEVTGGLVDRGGGVVDLGDVHLEVPAGAVGGPVELTAEVVDPPLPSFLKRQGRGYLLGPEGLQFDVPVTISLPIPDLAGPDAQLMTASRGSTQFRIVPSEKVDGRIRAYVRHFSYFVVAEPIELDGGVASADAGEAPDAQ